MIIVPSNEIILPVRLNLGLKGFFRMQCRNKFSGKVTQDTGWFPNTILNSGRNIMATRSDWLDWCQIGVNGTFPPTLPERQAEESLGTWLAGTDAVVSGSTSNGQAGTAPYFGWKRKTFRFSAGTFDGDIIAEAGVGWGVDGSQLISRSQILDPILQTPTTVTPLSDEMLDVSYELRYYPPLTDVLSPQVTLDGIVYDTITRAASVLGDRWSASIGTAIGQYSSAVTDWRAYDNVIGSILTGPSGVAANCDNANQSNSAYSDLSFAIVMSCDTGITGWNLGAPGIRSIRIRTTAGDYQTQFDANPGGATIPKDSNFTMHMEWTLSWSEYVEP